MSNETQNVVPISGIGGGQAEASEPHVYLNRCPAAESGHAILAHTAGDFPDVWTIDYEQIRLMPASGTVASIVSAFDEERLFGAELKPLFLSDNVPEAWMGKTILLPRTIFVGKGWGKSILAFKISPERKNEPIMLSFGAYFNDRVYVATWKQ